MLRETPCEAAILTLLAARGPLLPSQVYTALRERHGAHAVGEALRSLVRHEALLVLPGRRYALGEAGGMG